MENREYFDDFDQQTTPNEPASHDENDIHSPRKKKQKFEMRFCTVCGIVHKVEDYSNFPHYSILEKKFICLRCDRRFDSKCYFLQHLERLANQLQQLKMNRYRKGKDEIVSEIRRKKLQLTLESSRKVQDEKKKDLICSVCNTECPDRICLAMHMFLEHPTAYRDTAEKSSEPPEPSEPLEHSEPHEPSENKLVCEECGENFLEIYFFKQHLKIHIDDLQKRMEIVSTIFPMEDTAGLKKRLEILKAEYFRKDIDSDNSDLCSEEESFDDSHVQNKIQKKINKGFFKVLRDLDKLRVCYDTSGAKQAISDLRKSMKIYHCSKCKAKRFYSKRQYKIHKKYFHEKNRAEEQLEDPDFPRPSTSRDT